MTTTRTARPKPVTAEELLKMHSRGIKGELIRGVFCETMAAGRKHGVTAMTLGAFIITHVRPRRLGQVMGSDAGVLIEREPDTVREPDVAFISAERLPLDSDPPGYLEIPPDLVAEIISPTDRPAEVNDKTIMWLNLGVRMVWEVYPETREVLVHRPGMRFVVLTEHDTLDGGDVLPGFSIPVSEIFDV